jgi:hypothetical protein
LTVETAIARIEAYFANADVIAQDIVNAWGLNMRAGNGNLLTSEFLGVFDRACRYQEAKRLADFYRKHNVEDDEALTDETVSRPPYLDDKGQRDRGRHGARSFG